METLRKLKYLMITCLKQHGRISNKMHIIWNGSEYLMGRNFLREQKEFAHYVRTIFAIQLTICKNKFRKMLFFVIFKNKFCEYSTIANFGCITQFSMFSRYVSWCLLATINPLMPGGKKKVTHKQTCSVQLQVCFSMSGLFVTTRH